MSIIVDIYNRAISPGICFSRPWKGDMIVTPGADPESSSLSMDSGSRLCRVRNDKSVVIANRYPSEAIPRLPRPSVSSGLAMTTTLCSRVIESPCQTAFLHMRPCSLAPKRILPNTHPSEIAAPFGFLRARNDSAVWIPDHNCVVPGMTRVLSSRTVIRVKRSRDCRTLRSAQGSQ